MRDRRVPIRRRYILGALAAAATSLVALPVALATARNAAHRQLRPVIDVGYLYRQLYFMATHYRYRVSGEDGNPRNFNSPFNQPPLANGWQEFYRHWKQQVTSRKVMGPLSSSLTVSDHYFPTAGMPWDSDVREVTIPGASCPGERVLVAGHPDSTPGANSGNGSTYDDTSGVTMGMTELKALMHWYEVNHTWPTRTLKIGLFDAEETGLNGSYYYASHLIPKGRQGQYVMVANMDQNGLEYPAFHFGTVHFTSNPTGKTGPWYTNINASPLHNSPIYTGRARKLIKAHIAQIRRFRADMLTAVKEAFAVLGAKYHHSIPLENPLERGATAPAYTAAQQRRYSPVQDDTLGRTDQVPFIALGIPGYGIVGAYDANSKENPAPQRSPLRPPIFDYAGYDSPRDTPEHLNLLASGRPFGKGGEGTPSVELQRALELPATWTSYLMAMPRYAGATRYPTHPVAYFETSPVQPTSTERVHFTAAFSANALRSGSLHYDWSVGDGTFAQGRAVTHTYRHPIFANVQLVVTDGRDRIGTYEQGVAVHNPHQHAPATPACGLFSAAAAHRVIQAASHT